MDSLQLLGWSAVALFALGLLGVIIRRNVLVMLMCMELMLNAVNLSLVVFAQHHRDRVLQGPAVEPGCGRGGGQHPDHREQDPLLLGQVRLEVGPDRLVGTLDPRQLGVAGAVDGGHLPSEGGQSGQLGVEIGVVDGFEVVDQHIGGHQRPIRFRLRFDPAHLVEDGLVSRTAYAEVPPRVEYELTALGRTLLPLLVSLAEWAMAHRDEINAHRTSPKA